jgi:hypothetical protein
MKVKPTILVAIACLFFCPRALQAEITVTIQDTTVTPGGTVDLDILIEGDGADAALSNFYMVIGVTEIVPDGTSSLTFIDPDTNAYLEDADYIFAGVSESFIDFDGDSTSGDAEAVVIQDAHIDPDETVTVIDGTPSLLATLRFEHDLDGLAPDDTVGTVFRLDADLILTEFVDLDGNAFILNDDEDVFGFITVSASAVPEPGAFGLLAMMTGTVICRRRRRRK